jgi:large subunit ribosomal protein L33
MWIYSKPLYDNLSFVMSGKKNKKKDNVKLSSTGGTGYFKVKKRNSKAKPEKLSFKKYDPVLRKHVLFKEEKLSS